MDWRGLTSCPVGAAVSEGENLQGQNGVPVLWRGCVGRGTLWG